ncbi:hypothetical protein ACFQJC_04405 [Haloferax namakaokahaiae]|uniref:Uncharacterized protein n=1 Tax=Haloferax namakaokahaiae TaxID=1748331 RepID=A0ABD5ZCA9_9EURY
MATFTDFLVALVQSIIDLTVAFADVALSDPLSTISFLFGNLFIIASVGALVYLVLGALVSELVVTTGADRRSQRKPAQRE